MILCTDTAVVGMKNCSYLPYIYKNTKSKYLDFSQCYSHIFWQDCELVCYTRPTFITFSNIRYPIYN